MSFSPDETLPCFVISGPKFNPESFVRHDPMGYIAPDRTFNISTNLPVPVNMFMPPVIPSYGMAPLQGMLFVGEVMKSSGSFKQNYSIIWWFRTELLISD